MERAERSGRLLIALEDEGPGIPEEELSHVANRSFHGRHRSASGSGLGPAIVELALRRLNASLTPKTEPIERAFEPRFR
jgi:two-component system sensor histidine kinase QseC